MKKAAVVITGCHGGIGKALVTCFRESDIDVIGLDIEPGSADVNTFIQVDFATVVVSSEDQGRLSRELSLALEGKSLRALVNNAAVQVLGGTESLSIEDMRNSLDVNVVAPFFLSQLCLPALKESRGAIINIGSIHNQLTKPGFVAYATSKGALDTMTKSMAVDIGQYVRVNIVVPAAINTDMLKEGFINNPQGFAELESYHPAGEIGSPEQVAELVYFLVTTKASFINGAAIEITGGISSRLHDPE